MIYTKTFWLDTLERCLYTAAECLLGSIVGTNAIVTSIQWDIVLATTLTATLVTLLKCIIVGIQADNAKIAQDYKDYKNEHKIDD